MFLLYYDTETVGCCTMEGCKLEISEVIDGQEWIKIDGSRICPVSAFVALKMLG